MSGQGRGIRRGGIVGRGRGQGDLRRGIVAAGQGRRRDRGRGVRMRGGGQRRVRAVVTNEIRATIIDHVINHGLSLREAGERVQPNLSRSTVASIIRIFQQTNRLVIHFMSAILAFVMYHSNC